MNSIARRIAATAALAVAPALLALGVATSSQAETTVADNGPTVSVPTHHEAFPHQVHIKPGTPEHHHHHRHNAH